MSIIKKKKEEKRFLTEIQKMLLMEKSEKLQLALGRVEQRKTEMSMVVTLCARELKIPDEETWILSDKLDYFLKQEEPKKNDKNGG